jgi:molybdopterin/thiamine biosynthesis adenylyltransferase
MKVLLFGLRGVGVETAKNLALQGVGAITVTAFH